MTDGGRKPDKDEVTDEQLDDVAGGTLPVGGIAGPQRTPGADSPGELEPMEEDTTLKPQPINEPTKLFP